MAPLRWQLLHEGNTVKILCALSCKVESKTIRVGTRGNAATLMDTFTACLASPTSPTCHTATHERTVRAETA